MKTIIVEEKPIKLILKIIGIDIYFFLAKMSGKHYFKEAFQCFGLWGTLGGLAIGYRSIKYSYAENRQSNLVAASFFAIGGYVICEIFPIIVPVAIAAVAYEEYAEYKPKEKPWLTGPLGTYITPPLPDRPSCKCKKKD